VGVKNVFQACGGGGSISDLSFGPLRRKIIATTITAMIPMMPTIMIPPMPGRPVVPDVGADMYTVRTGSCSTR